MLTISKVLSVIDPTAADQPALRRAAWLAKKAGAELELLVCYYNEYLSGTACSTPHRSRKHAAK